MESVGNRVVVSPEVSDMTRLIKTFALLSLALTMFAPKAVSADWTVGLESGIVLSGYNDIQIPNNTGTKLSLTDDLSTDTKPFARLTVEYSFRDRHTLSALFAPLSLRANGQIDQEVLFDETRFPGGSDFNALYKFNSYRLTYRYALHRSNSLSVGLGFTGKIRDAAVVLEAAGMRDEYTNVGFVPLLNFKLEYNLANRFSAILAGDALASPGGQGRAEDVSAMIHYQVNKSFRLKAGYRVLEGGADVDDVYSFALLHYVAAGIQLII
jgi:hypothetical protein